MNALQDYWQKQTQHSSSASLYRVCWMTGGPTDPFSAQLCDSPPSNISDSLSVMIFPFCTEAEKMNAFDRLATQLVVSDKMKMKC